MGKKGQSKPTKLSVLNRQKPKKGRRTGRNRWLLAGAVASTCLVAALALIGSRTLKNQATASSAVKVPWRVTLKLEGDEPLADKTAESIIATVRRGLGQGDPSALTRTARQIQQLESFASVHLLRLDREQVTVTLHRRSPQLCLQADKVRLISSTGDVYGSPDPTACPGPVVLGIIQRANTHYAMQSNYTLELTDDEQTAVNEVLTLWSELQESKLAVASIEYRLYRGFIITLRDNATEVAVGRAPFNGRLSRLSEILAKLAQKGETAQRIELDYQGKAFIKLKKI